MFLVKEMFVEFIDCAEKTGDDISKLIFDKLKKHCLQKKKLRGQGYVKENNMKGGLKAHSQSQCLTSLTI